MEKKRKNRRGMLLLAIVAIVGAIAFGGTSAVLAISNMDNTGGFSLAGMVSSYRMFYGAGELTGGNGTSYNGNIIDASAAVVDSADVNGYFSVSEEQDYNVKYAVCIFGINHDTYLDSDGNEQTAGLTFGPACMTDYRSSYSAHLTEEEFNEGESGVCLHWMTWEEIIIQSEIDPTVFEECLEEGCTHSVDLVLNSKLLGTSYAGKMDKGDGASALKYSIASTYLAWNSSYSETECSTYWSESRMRATLNGKDGYTNSTYAGTDTLSSAECLFSCFPDVLQEAVVAKAVKTNTVYQSTDENDVKTTYDRLWLFSTIEIYNGNYSDNKKYEGTQYARASEVISLGDSGTGIAYPGLTAYDESGESARWWLRSASTLTYLVGFVSFATYPYSIKVSDTGTLCISPGFCLP